MVIERIPITVTSPGGVEILVYREVYGLFRIKRWEMPAGDRECNTIQYPLAAPSVVLRSKRFVHIEELTAAADREANAS
jgi:hypothetical protein